MMLEDRTIPLWSYNPETLLAEKLETVVSRGVANTRMRDFYDIHVIFGQEKLNVGVLRDALLATSRKRSTSGLLVDLDSILRTIEEDATMQRLWRNYAADSFYVGDLAWGDVMASVRALAGEVG